MTRSTNVSEDEIRCTLGYIAVRLAHLSHDALGDSKAAARLYKDAVDIDPLPSSISWHGIGTSIEASNTCSANIGDACTLELDKAIEAYREAWKLAPGSYRVAFDLAVALERRSKIKSKIESNSNNINDNDDMDIDMDTDTDMTESEEIMEKLRRGGADANSRVDSWGYVRWHTRLIDPQSESLNLHRGTRAMLQLALDEAWDLIHQANGLVCEFGVASGRSMRMTKEILPLDTPAHGFDTFTGLPQGAYIMHVR